MTVNGGFAVITMLERLSLEKAMRLSFEQPITVISRRGTDIRQYVLLRYDGYSQRDGCHLFEVRMSSGVICVLTDIELGLRGDAATARFAEPERCASTQEIIDLRVEQESELTV
jgi:hypothetical protein